MATVVVVMIVIMIVIATRGGSSSSSNSSSTPAPFSEIRIAGVANGDSLQSVAAARMKNGVPALRIGHGADPPGRSGVKDRVVQHQFPEVVVWIVVVAVVAVVVVIAVCIRTYTMGGRKMPSHQVHSKGPLPGEALQRWQVAKQFREVVVLAKVGSKSSSSSSSSSSTSSVPVVLVQKAKVGEIETREVGKEDHHSQEHGGIGEDFWLGQREIQGFPVGLSIVNVGEFLDDRQDPRVLLVIALVLAPVLVVIFEVLALALALALVFVAVTVLVVPVAPVDVADFYGGIAGKAFRLPGLVREEFLEEALENRSTALVFSSIITAGARLWHHQLVDGIDPRNGSLTVAIGVGVSRNERHRSQIGGVQKIEDFLPTGHRKGLVVREPRATATATAAATAMATAVRTATANANANATIIIVNIIIIIIINNNSIMGQFHRLRPQLQWRVGNFGTTKGGGRRWRWQWRWGAALPEHCGMFVCGWCNRCCEAHDECYESSRVESSWLID